MITEQDLKQAIAECQGERNPTANTCIKLAAFYTIRNELYGKTDRMPDPSYSFAAGPAETISRANDYSSDTDFGRAVSGMDTGKVMAIIDELMNTLQVMYPKLYDAVMRKLQG